MRARRLLNLTGDRLYALPLLVLYLTDGCNSRCVTCDIWKNPRQNMSMALVEQLAGACRDLGVSQVLFSGGEAMQHPQWAAIAQRFRQAGARVMLLTNGLLLRKQAQDVIEHVDELILSLDGGTAATYQAIRGVDAFELLLDGVRAVRAGGIPVTTRTTVQRANFRELAQIIDAAKRVDVNRISFLAVDVSNAFAFGPRFVPDTAIPVMVGSAGVGTLPGHGPVATALDAAEVGELAALIDDLEQRYAADFTSRRIAESPDKLRRILVRYFGALAGMDTFPAPPCNAPHFSVVVNVDGSLQPCYFLPAFGKLEPETADGSLGTQLNTDVAQALRRAYRSGQRVECARCVCPLHRGPRGLLGL